MQRSEGLRSNIFDKEIINTVCSRLNITSKLLIKVMSQIWSEIGQICCLSYII